MATGDEDVGWGLTRTPPTAVPMRVPARAPGIHGCRSLRLFRVDCCCSSAPPWSSSRRPARVEACLSDDAPEGLPDAADEESSCD